ncbi:MAG: putative response regulatory protein [Herbinix sp.]|jgi:two-component system response regulator YesN|nr:putative response regulatory protein [Herbinix sp.]
MKIVIVEDEIRIREGIINLIKKIKEEYEVVGEAENGVEGLRLVKETKPDLIITDIKMLDMDGLEMLRILKEEKFSIKAIVLSAYSEFSYAQQAIKLGISEYLLKPIAVGELTQSLKNIEIQLEQERSQQGKHLEVLQTLDNVFYGILLGGITVDKELTQFLERTYQLDDSSNFIMLPIFLGDYYEQNHKKMSRVLHSVLREQDNQEYRLLEIPQNKILLLVIFSYRDEHALKRWFQNNVLLQLKNEKSYQACFGWSSFQGISMMKNRLNILLKHMDWSITLGDDVIISYPQVTQIQTKLLSYPIDIENQMRVALCALDRKRIEKIIHNFCFSFKDGNLYSPKEIKESYVRFLWSMINVVKEINFTQYKSFEQQIFLERIMSAMTYIELEHTLKEFVTLLSKDMTEEKLNGLTIQRAKSLVHEFYNQGITLDEIALKLNITPEYLGTQFHKEVGVNFGTYIKNFRIKKAKEMLIGTHLKLYEIAEKVGYSDSKYFSQVFKECTGQLPTEYRMMNH